MSHYRKKPVTIEAITFDELVEHGKAAYIEKGWTLNNGMPWSFDYQGQPITHENDDCYLIPTLEGTMKFNRGEMLITGVREEIYPCKADIFAATYEPADPPAPLGREPSREAVEAAANATEHMIGWRGIPFASLKAVLAPALKAAYAIDFPSGPDPVRAAAQEVLDVAEIAVNLIDEFERGSLRIPFSAVHETATRFSALRAALAARTDGTP